MKKRQLKKTQFVKTTISNLEDVLGGFTPKTGVSRCHAGSGNDCCAAK
jgi:hypothetical protein